MIQRKVKAITVILLYIFIVPANGQKLNEAYLQAKADMMGERYAEAEQKILSVPASERTAPMYLALGESCYRLGRYIEAARFFAAADSLKTVPDAELGAARACAMTQQSAKAVEWLQKYLTRRDKLAESELSLDPAFAKMEHSREWKALWSREWYSAAERKAAEAAVLFKRKKYIEALGVIDAEIARAPSAKIYALRAIVYEAMEQYGPAFESMQSAVRLRNNSAEYLAAAANIAVRLKKYDAALDNINSAIRVDPYRLELYLQRATILQMTKRYDDARNDFNFYFAYLPFDAKALYRMGTAETAAGNPLTGIEYFTLLVDRDRTKPEYFVARADAYIRANDYAMAGNDLAQALDLNPALPEAWYKKGIILQQENKLEDACYYWKQALGMGNREAAEYIYKYCVK
jgi:tetratricopeptide (TPR) repeat protein